MTLPFHSEGDERLRWLGVAVEEKLNGFRAADSLLIAALLAYEFGLSSTPLRNKIPYVRGWQLKASSNIRDILEWRLGSITRGAACDYGIATGIERLIWVLDFDGRDAAENLARLEAKYGRLGPTWTVITPSGGFHLYFRARPHGEDLRTTSKVLGCALDVRGRGGQCVGPGAMGKHGRRYMWALDRAPDEVNLADLPDAWFDALPKYQDLATQKPATTRSRSRKAPPHVRSENEKSAVIGDGAGRGGFHRAIYVSAVRFYRQAGVGVDPYIPLSILKAAVLAAPVGPNRDPADISRYSSDNYLMEQIENARAYVARERRI